MQYIGLENNGTLREPMFYPTKLDLTKKIPEIFPPSDQMGITTTSRTDYIITKINCSWNKTMSLTDVIIADARSLENVSSHKIQSVITTLSNSWHSKEIEPPFIESISKYFSVNSMRKPHVPSKGKIKSKTGKKYASPKMKK